MQESRLHVALTKRDTCAGRLVKNRLFAFECLYKLDEPYLGRLFVTDSDLQIGGVIRSKSSDVGHFAQSGGSLCNCNPMADRNGAYLLRPAISKLNHRA